MGLTLLAQAQIPLTLWWEAFNTATYLINQLATLVLNHKSPFQSLFKKILDYKFLHPFGCAAYPCLTPYNTHKLLFHSLKCLFLGYSDNHKCYICLSPHGRIYISRHVIFDHADFPYPSFLNTQNTTQPETTQQLFKLASQTQNTGNRSSSSAVIVEHSSQLNRYIHDSFPPSSSHNTHFPYVPQCGEKNDPSSSSSTRYALPSQKFNTLPLPEPNTLPSIDSDSSTRYALPPVQNTTNTHPMTIRSKTGITKPKHPFVGNVSTTGAPNTVTAALQNPVWSATMKAEFSALQKNNTWTLVPALPHMNIVG